MNTYDINPYLIYSVDKQEEKHVIQTKKNSITINNTALFYLLEFIENEDISTITKEEIINFFEDNYDFSIKVIEFLIENGVFNPRVNKEVDFSKIAIYSEKHNGDLIDLFSNSLGNLNTVDSIEGYSNDLQELSILYVLLNPFNLKKFKEIVKHLNQYEQLIIKFIFPYNNSLYISNYYSKKWNNPCPICFFNSLEAQLRGNINGDINFNFQMMVDLLYRDNVDFSYEGLIDKSDLIPVINIILKDKINMNIERNIDKVYRVSLNNLYVDTDTAYYWEMCDCYE